ncbi:143341b5-df93-45c2-9236-803b6fdd5118 [Thermothielavioides terrestris]|uniref:143341b5-df93-45c2-9236-803b6fdd5118 n=1 Tax=Thermothielavioides terrestris TaxID=2587410 RepID=A0A446BNX0_9PEZI|nr:143341b5-df93-45c2-9236-803b6fdd5118 [Thermothielavioides terrestris]
MPSLRSIFSTFSGLAALHFAAGSASPGLGEQQAPLVSSDYRCEHPPYTAHLVSHSPLVIYIKNFITPAERAHLLKLGFQRDLHPQRRDHFLLPVLLQQQPPQPQPRPTSHRPQPPRPHLPIHHPAPSDPVVSCIETRALLFQSPGTPRSHLEPLQLVRYAPGEHYHFHTDWFTAPGAHAGADRGGNRRTSFFVYVRVEEGTLGGGTNFRVFGSVVVVVVVGLCLLSMEGVKRRGRGRVVV